MKKDCRWNSHECKNILLIVLTILSIFISSIPVFSTSTVSTEEPEFFAELYQGGNAIHHFAA